MSSSVQTADATTGKQIVERDHAAGGGVEMVKWPESGIRVDVQT